MPYAYRVTMVRDEFVHPEQGPSIVRTVSQEVIVVTASWDLFDLHGGGNWRIVAAKKLRDADKDTTVAQLLAHVMDEDIYNRLFKSEP